MSMIEAALLQTSSSPIAYDTSNLSAGDFEAQLQAVRPTARRDTFAGLAAGSSGENVARLQRVLKKWNPKLGVQANGQFDEATKRAVQLYRSIYTSSPGTQVDGATSDALSKMEDGSFWKDPPSKTPGQQILYEASRKLGTPYVLGGDGNSSIDCGMLTSKALKASGVSASRMADEQFRMAKDNAGGLSLKGQPQPGDLVFMRIPTSQSGQAYGGVTHVGLYVGDGTLLAASSSARKVVLQDLHSLSPYVAGYGRASKPQGGTYL